MKRLIAITFAAALSTGAALASNDLPLDSATQDKIRATLTEQGYDVRKIEVEDGQFEVYVLKDGKKLELYLDTDLNVTRTKNAD